MLDINYQVGIGEVLTALGLVGAFLAWSIAQWRELKSTKQQVASIQDLLERLERERKARETLAVQHDTLELKHLEQVAESLNYSSWVYSNLSDRSRMESQTQDSRMNDLARVVGHLGAERYPEVRPFVKAFINIQNYEQNWRKALHDNTKAWETERESRPQAERNDERRLGQLEQSIAHINSTHSGNYQELVNNYGKTLHQLLLATGSREDPDKH